MVSLAPESSFDYIWCPMENKPTLATLQSEYIRAVCAGSPSAQYWKEEILSFRPEGVNVSDWVWDTIESLPHPDDRLKGLIKRGCSGPHRGYFNREFPNEDRAYQIRIFGRLDLPEGVSTLEGPLSFEQSIGGNNHSRWAELPAGTQVAYYRTPGSEANILFADKFPK